MKTNEYLQSIDNRLNSLIDKIDNMTARVIHLEEKQGQFDAIKDYIVNHWLSIITASYIFVDSLYRYGIIGHLK